MYLSLQTECIITETMSLADKTKVCFALVLFCQFFRWKRKENFIFCTMKIFSNLFPRTLSVLTPPMHHIGWMKISDDTSPWHHFDNVVAGRGILLKNHRNGGFQLKIARNGGFLPPLMTPTKSDGLQHATMETIELGRNAFAEWRKLNASNRLEAIYVLNVSVLTYIFNILSWKMIDINGLHAKTRSLLNVRRIHNPG